MIISSLFIQHLVANVRTFQWSWSTKCKASAVTTAAAAADTAANDDDEDIAVAALLFICTRREYTSISHARTALNALHVK